MNQSPNTITDSLRSVGISCDERGTGRFIISSQTGPIFPNGGNSFWLLFKDGAWYLSTWLPVSYRIPVTQDVIALCSACMKAVSSAMYFVPDEISERFGLEMIPDEDLELLFPEQDSDD